MQYKQLWARNGWKVVVCNPTNGRDKAHVQVWDERKSGSGMSYNPLLYDWNGQVVWDHLPPKYVRVATTRILRKVGNTPKQLFV